MAALPLVLVIEDDDAIRSLLVAALRREPVEVHSAANGAEALDLTRSTDYAVILLDLMMPHVNGMEFLTAFHEQRPESKTVLFLMTAFDDVTVRRLSPALVHGILRKPFDVPQLVTMVREVVRTRNDATAVAAPAIDAAAIADDPKPPEVAN